MTINFNKKTIELSKSEMKEAKIFGSEMYNDLQTARKDYPKFKVVELKAKKSKAILSTLDMNSITEYVERHGTDEQKNNFNLISKSSISESGEYVKAQSFFKIKAWFLNEFPEIKQWYKVRDDKITNIYEAAASKNVA